LPILNYTLPTADTEYLLLWFRNDDPNRLFHIDRYYISWNGADGYYNRTVDVRLYMGTPEPSANYVSFSPGNLNQSSPRVALATAYLWDTVGDGMTVSSLGTKAQAGYFAQGAVQFDVDGTFILGYGDVIGITAIPEEAGKMSIVISGWYSSIEGV
jgi:hypothetical protein